MSMTVARGSGGRSHVTFVGDTATPDDLRPKHIAKEEFGRRVQKLRLAQGWTQSELARYAGLTRDDVSRYTRGISFPTEPKLKKLAAVLKMTPEKLLPNYTESAIDHDVASFEIRASSATPDNAWLRVNRLVTMDTATKVATLLQNDHASVTKSSR